MAHVLWIGGATDSGKSTIAQNLGERYGMHVYHYDSSDAEHLKKLAESDLETRQFLDASLDERWIHPDPDALFAFLLHSFPLRFPLLIEDILTLSVDIPVIVEGFGLLPELVLPIISNLHQAVWLVPTDTFKWESMARRGKPSYAKKTSDPKEAKMNLFARDMILAKYYRKRVPTYGFTLFEVDGSSSIEEMTNLVDKHFAKHLDSLR